MTTNTAYKICRSEYRIGRCKLDPLQIRKKTQTFIELLPSVRLWMAPAGYGGGYATTIPRLRHLSLPPPPASIPTGGSRIPPDSSPGGYPRPGRNPRRCKAPNTIVGLVAAGQSEVAERAESSKSADVQRIDGDHEEDNNVPLSGSSLDSTIGSLIRCKRIYNF
jgi:hypothetical protein